MQACVALEAAAEVQKSGWRRSLTNQTQRAPQHDWINEQASLDHLFAQRLG